MLDNKATKIRGTVLTIKNSTCESHPVALAHPRLSPDSRRPPASSRPPCSQAPMSALGPGMEHKEAAPTIKSRLGFWRNSDQVISTKGVSL